MAYQPIQNYGIVGDMHTVALIGIDGSIDWLCIPRFDSPSVFAAILDDGKGGCFRIAPTDKDITCKQFYWPDTNVLVTRFLAPLGAAEVTDFMPVGETRPGGPKRRLLIRRVTADRGTVRIRMLCRPAFNFARDRHETALVDGGAIFTCAALRLGLVASVPLTIEGDGVVSEFTLEEGQKAIFALEDLDHAQRGLRVSEGQIEALFRGTVSFWRNWLSQCRYAGRWREMVYRSVLALKLLTYEPTGAIVAAPTCSLPERVGGGRNWDYRYTWVRDSAFTIFAFLRLGFTEEATRFMYFLSHLCKKAKKDGSLQIMYGIDGRGNLDEETLDHLDGYMGSQPVRVGNAAFAQLQLDIYGELLDAVYLYNKNHEPIAYDTWLSVHHLADWVCDNWNQEDEGIWEVRGGPQHFVYSKLMSWVALDRALRIAEGRSFPANRARWLGVRDRIFEEIIDKGWSETRKAFVQHYGSDSLDAANLMMPMVFFLAPNDPRMLSTLDAILLPPDKGGLVANSLVHRYNIKEFADGLADEEGTFNICTFWLVEALTRAGRFDRARLEDARLMFERMLGFANHVGLYAEETGPSGEALGNFPQAFTHLALITAAISLDQALGSQG